jgi:hypothetical protein
MSSNTGGGNLFGSRMTWARIAAIAVIFTVWSQVSSCNTETAAKEQYARDLAAATPQGAIDYCTKWLRDTQGTRQQFQISKSQATRRAASSTNFDVVLAYSYLNTYTKKTVTDVFNCAAGYGGNIDKGWHTLRR